MRILFLTSSLEPGRDGVGDYTRLLARECVRQGHDVSLLALNDSHVTETSEVTEAIGSDFISILRLPQLLPWKQRIELALAFRSRTPVDWISLQFVAFGLESNGVVRHFPARIKPILKGAFLHIMFHELWLAGVNAPFRHLMLGRIQRYFLKRMIRQLRPQVMTTTTPWYQSLLRNIGKKSTELPLFGNIEIGPVLEPMVPSFSQGLFFGTLHPEWQAEPFMGMWIAAAALSQKQPCLVSLGHMGVSGEKKWRKMEQEYAGRVDFLSVGEQLPEVVSSWLQMADFGVAASPWYLMGKSGSAAAMLDHGLPVIVTRMELPDVAVSSLPADPLLHRCDSGLKAKLAKGLPKRRPRSRVIEVANKFIGLLEKATRH